jgi:D-threo-aldose 1-dehydrogenase
MRAHEDGLQRLGLDRIDILLVHDIGEFQHGVEENARHFADLTNSGYRAMEELRSSGQVSAIGLGVNENEICRRALDIGQWDVFLLAGRYTLLEQTPLDDLFPACQAAGTSILVGREMWNYAKAPEDIVSRVAQLKQIGTEFGVPLAAAALQFPLGHSIVSSVIPGSRSDEEFAGILAWANHDIPADYWTKLQSAGLLHAEAPVPSGNPYT